MKDPRITEVAKILRELRQGDSLAREDFYEHLAERLLVAQMPKQSPCRKCRLRKGCEFSSLLRAQCAL